MPPDNKPLGAEVAACRVFLSDEVQAGPNPQVVLSLGSIAHNSVVRALGLAVARHPFAHGAVYRPPGRPILVASYHCSRYNLNTGRLTPAMFEDVFAAASRELAA